ncbi:MAG: hypothetical protein ACUVWX_05350 [Kiritimatiellia bacterium]
MKIRRVFFLLLFFAFLAGIFWWCLILPFSPKHLYRAVPVDAVWIGQHTSLAAHWPTISRNPLVRLLLKNLGFSESQIEKMLTGHNLAWLINTLATRETLIGYSPNTVGPGLPGFFVVTWVGRRARLIEAGFYRSLLKDFTRVELGGGRRGWVQTTKPSCPLRYLSLAVHDGILLVCLSDVPDGVVGLLQRALSSRTLAAPLRNELAHRTSRRPLATTSPDRGWLRLSGTPDCPELLSYFLDLEAERHISGTILADATCSRFDCDLPLLDANAIPTNLLRDTPDVVIVVPASLLLHLARKLPPSWSLVAEILECMCLASENTSPAFIALEGGDFSGRILGLRVPSLILGLRSMSGLQLEKFVGDQLDRLNAKYKLGLIPKPEARLLVLEGTRRGIYSSLGPDERCAVASSGGWLFLATNAGMSRKLLDESHNSVSAEKLWWQPQTLPKNAWGHVAVRVPQTTENLANALAVYSLALLLRNSNQDQQAMKTAENIQAWLTRLKGVEILRLSLQTCDDNTLRIDFRATVTNHAR